MTSEHVDGANGLVAVDLVVTVVLRKSDLVLQDVSLNTEAEDVTWDYDTEDEVENRGERAEYIMRAVGIHDGPTETLRGAQ